MTELETQVATIRELKSQLEIALDNRDRLIVDQIRNGKTLREVAEIAQLSFPRVQQIVREDVYQQKSR